jgi:hypothetical protein
MKRSAIAWCLCLLAGCGSPATMMTLDSGMPDSGQPQMPSMVTASGQLTGTIAAPAALVGYEATMDDGHFVLTKTSGMGLKFTFDMNVDFGGMPGVKTYTSASPGFSCNVTVADGTTPANTWIALFNQPPQMNKGTCSLTFTSVSMSGSGYTTAGNFSITADNSGGASTGMVTVMGTF